MESRQSLVFEEVSIYNLHSKSKKAAILLAGAAIALLTPFTDTVYLPALKSVGESLNASDASVAATVSAYLGNRCNATELEIDCNVKH